MTDPLAFLVGACRSQTSLESRRRCQSAEEEQNVQRVNLPTVLAGRTLGRGAPGDRPSLVRHWTLVPTGAQEVVADGQLPGI